MTWLESICLTVRQNADDVACIEALLVILHQKLVDSHSGFDRQFFPWYAAAQTGGTDGQAISRDTERG
jgi:hypothetical protein